MPLPTGCNYQSGEKKPTRRREQRTPKGKAGGEGMPSPYIYYSNIIPNSPINPNLWGGERFIKY